MPSPRSSSFSAARFSAVLLALVFVVSACTGSGSDDASSSTSGSILAGGRTAVDGLITACNTAMSADPPDIARLALDPAVTGQIVSIPDEFVRTAAEELTDCLGTAQSADYVSQKLLVAGIGLPVETARCIETAAGGEITDRIEFTLRRARLEPPETGLAEPFITDLIDCVPAQYLAAPARAENEFGYLLSVDNACFDAVPSEQPEVMPTFWEFQLLNSGAPDVDALDDDEVALLVGPLYDCIDTGNFIATDPSTGAALSDSSRVCIGEVARTHGFWESKVAQRPIDVDSYEAGIESCLTPEEAASVLGTPIPVDDPEASHFADVDDCWAELRPDGGELEPAALDPAELNDIGTELADCAGVEGTAGRMASMQFGSRFLPQGSYDCILPFAVADPAGLLRARLAIEGDHTTSGSDAATYRVAASTCIPMNMPTRGLWVDYANPALANTIDFTCIDLAYRSDTDALEAFWLGTTEGGFSTEDEAGTITPSPLAARAVAPLYGCVDTGRGVAALFASTGEAISLAAAECISTEIPAIGVLELRLINQEVPDNGFNRTIADCIDRFPEDR